MIELKHIVKKIIVKREKEKVHIFIEFLDGTTKLMSDNFPANHIQSIFNINL